MRNCHELCDECTCMRGWGDGWNEPHGEECIHDLEPVWDEEEEAWGCEKFDQYDPDSYEPDPDYWYDSRFDRED